MTPAERQSAFRKRRDEKLSRLLAFAEYAADFLKDSDKPRSVHLRKKALEALGAVEAGK